MTASPSNVSDNKVFNAVRRVPIVRDHPGDPEIIYSDLNALLMGNAFDEQSIAWIGEIARNPVAEATATSGVDTIVDGGLLLPHPPQICYNPGRNNQTGGDLIVR